MPIMENVRLSLRQSRKFGKEIDPESKFGLLSCSVTSCSGSGYGSGFSNTPFTTENSAVFAPIPSASVRIATAANPGDFAIILTPKRKSCISRSSNPHPHASRVTSRTNSTFPNSRSADAGLALWREDDCKVAGIRGGGDSDAGARDRREYGAVLGSERSVAESAAVPRAGATRDAAREQAEF